MPRNARVSWSDVEWNSAGLDASLDKPLFWRKPRRILIGLKNDLFHEDVPTRRIEAVFGVMHVAAHHTFQIVTEHPERMREFIGDATMERCLAEYTVRVGHGEIREESPAGRRDRAENMPGGWEWPPQNAYLGVSASTQDDANERIPHLLETPAATRFLLCDPLLEQLNINVEYEICPLLGTTAIPDADIDYGTIDWVIAGGESGPKARPCDLAWIRSIVKQCKNYEVPVFISQLGSAPIDSAYVDIVGPDEKVHYCRPVGDRLIAEAHATLGYTTKPHNVGRLLRDKKGKDMKEWPLDLHIQEFPGVMA